MPMYDVTYDPERHIYLMVWIDYALNECELWHLTLNNMVTTKGHFCAYFNDFNWMVYILIEVECTYPYLSYFSAKCRFGIVDYH